MISLIKVENAIDFVKHKVCLVGSSGGHLTHLYALQGYWGMHERFWVTFDKEDARSLLIDETVYWCHYPTNRNIPNLIKNTFLAIKILKKEKPNIIISTGAGAAIPFFWLAHFFGAKTVFIEVYDRIDNPTLTGRLVSRFSDVFIVQWDELFNYYRGAINIGKIF